MKHNGIDNGKRIVGARGPTPYLFNILPEFVQRFREQITVVDLINEGSPDVMRQAVWSCYQEVPTPFSEYTLCDSGAFSEPPLSGKITWRVTNPVIEPKDDQERSKVEKLRLLMDRVKQAVETRKRGESPPLL